MFFKFLFTCWRCRLSRSPVNLTLRMFLLSRIRQTSPRLFRKCCLIYQAEFTSELVDDVVRAVMILGSSWLCWRKVFFVFLGHRSIENNGVQWRHGAIPVTSPFLQGPEPARILGQNPDDSATVCWDKVSCSVTTSCEPFWLLCYVVCVSVDTCNSSNSIWSSVPL